MTEVAVPPTNQQRRDALADAAISIIARDGICGLSHRKVDEAAAVPRGTASNYFRSKDALLEGAAARIAELHFAWITDLRDERGPGLTREALVEVLAGVAKKAVTDHRERYVAMLELLLEGARRPEMHQGLSDIVTGTTRLIREAHRAEDLEPTERQLHLIRISYAGVLLSYLVAPEVLVGFGPGQATEAFLELVLGTG